MARLARRIAQGQAVGFALAVALAGCGGDNVKERTDGSADARDAADARDLRADLPSDKGTGGDAGADRADTGTDARDGAGDGSDASLGGAPGTGGNGAGGAAGMGAGGMGAGGTAGTGAGGTGAGGTAGTGAGGTAGTSAGGTAGSGTGGVAGSGAGGTAGSGAGGVAGSGAGGTAGSGAGGVAGSGAGGTAGSGLGGTAGAAPDGGTDVPVGGTGGAIGAGGTTGAGGTGGIADAGTDAGCGTGCPSSVRPGALAIWLAADYGVQCDSGMRVTSWTNRGKLGGAVTPATTQQGPLCASATLFGPRNALLFDAPGTDDTSGVLKANLSPLIGHGYTVFVVERRQSAGEGYLLGTSLNDALPELTCDPFPDGYGGAAYRFGYGFQVSSTPDPKLLYYGGYVPDPMTTCKIPMTAPPAFSPGNPQGALDVEIFDATAGHTVLANGTTLMTDDVTDLIDSLAFDAWIGRAYQAIVDSPTLTRHSRFKGDIAEIVIYDVTLGAADVQAVSDYLATRWGLTLAH